jgi:hypothetical protein
MENMGSFMAFVGESCIASGELREVLTEASAWCSSHAPEENVLFFEDRTGQQVDFDLRGTTDEVLARLSSHPTFGASAAAEPDANKRGPGRPKLGVVSREVSLLPRHWEWLEAQRGGISVALRSLVDAARKRGLAPEDARRAREAAGKFMWSMAGNLPSFEEASRALYAKDDARLHRLTHDWPKDIRTHLHRLVAQATKLETETDADQERRV